MKLNITNLLGGLILGFACLQACQIPDGSNTKKSENLPDSITLDTGKLANAYQTFRENSLHYRRFKHHDLESLITKHREQATLQVDLLGQSVLGKNIYRLNYGKGPKKVMLWSQMHGNEATATMALMDIFNFLEGEGDSFDPIRRLLKENTTLHFIPMLNPDGADKFVRRNALDIDLNRDARMGGTLEGTLLIQEAERIKPDYGFNLHDQNIYYNVPGTGTPVSIALLAPAYNPEREVNSVRSRAMKLAVGMNELLQKVIPGGVARYDDEYTPRGFGDNFQMWGASTILIESGGFKGDPEKQEIRRLNFMIILNALVEIARDDYEKYSIEHYEQIPYNASYLTDVLLRGIEVTKEDHTFITDISIKRSEVNQDRDYYIRSSIDDLGDLQDLFGYQEVGSRKSTDTKKDANFSIIPGKVYPKTLSNLDELTDEKVLNMLKDGFTAVKIAKNTQQLHESKIHSWPIILFSGSDDPNPTTLRLGSEATFMLKDAQGLKYALVNGYLIDLDKSLTDQFGKPEQRHIRNLIRK